ncbi:Transpos_assoc domain-containing protein, partial [Cephalotus follicularis]
VGFGDYQR